MSDTAWRNKITKAIPYFFDAAREYLNEIFEKQSKEKSKKSKSIMKNYRCYALDATNLPIEGDNYTVIRVHTQYELYYDCLKYAIITDNHIAESTTLFTIEKDSLYMADRAYGRSKQLAYIVVFF